MVNLSNSLDIIPIRMQLLTTAHLNQFLECAACRGHFCHHVLSSWVSGYFFRVTDFVETDWILDNVVCFQQVFVSALAEELKRGHWQSQTILVQPRNQDALRGIEARA